MNILFLFLSKNDIYLTKKETRRFLFFCHFFVYKKSDLSIFIVLVYVHQTHLFSARLNFQITFNAAKTCFCIFCTCAVMHQEFCLQTAMQTLNIDS